MSTQQDQSTKNDWINLILLRPYGADTLTPKVKFWIACSLVVILLMSSLEGLVWGMISRHLVPESDGILRAIITSIVSFSVFCLIWIADTSLIVFEPKPRYQNTPSSFIGSIGGWLRNNWTFLLGIVFRIGIIGISLYITAPMLTQVIRDDDISRQIESERLKIKTDFINKKENDFDKEIALLKAQAELAKQASGINSSAQSGYDTALKSLDGRIKQFREDVSKYESERDDQRIGNKAKGIKKGEGPRYHAAITNLDKAQQALQQANAERDKLKLPIIDNSETERKLKEIDKNIDTATTEFKNLKKKVEAMGISEFAEYYKQDLPEKLPENTPGQRIKILKALNEAEQIPHWQSTEGMAQALLIVLFLSLLALKSFEPDEVRIYFNENLQEAWLRYTKGLLDDLPGFKKFKKQISSYDSFVESYSQYQRNASHYMEEEEKLEAEQRTLQINQTQEALAMERQRLALEMENRKAEIVREEKRLAHEFDMREKSLLSEQEQNQKELQLRKERMEKELAIEMDKLRAVAENLEKERNLHEDLARQEAEQKKLEHDLAIRSMEEKISAEKRRADLEIEERVAAHEAKVKTLELELAQANTKAANDQQRLEQELEHLISNLEQERLFSATEKQQLLEHKEKELAIRLEELEETFNAKKEAQQLDKQQEAEQREYENGLARTRLQEELNRERDRFTQEIAERRAESEREQLRLKHEIDLREKSLAAEQAQNQKELEFRKERMEKEYANELEKINAVKEQAQHELNLKERSARIALIQEEMKRVEIDKENLNVEIQSIEQTLEIENISAKQLNEEIEKANLDPGHKKINITNLVSSLEQARQNLTENIRKKASVTTIDGAKQVVASFEAELKAANEEFEKSANQQPKPLLQLAEVQKRINELSYRKNTLVGRQRALDAELETWREKRRELI